MSEYEVELPVYGVVYTTVEAESEEEAIQKALENYDSEDLQEWTAVREIVSGNVCYASPNTASAQKV